MKLSTFSSNCNFHFLILLLFVPLFNFASGVLRYSEQSCSDLAPRTVEDYNEARPDYSQFYQGRSYYRVKRSVYGDEIPYKVSVTEKRYRRNSDLLVRIEGGDFDGLMLQSRVVAGGELLRGGVGLIGQFRYLPYLFQYIPCFGLPYATIADKGRPVRIGNVSFVWTAPDTEAGDIRFIASVLRGINYWIITSNTLKFNPFPISTYTCGSTMACFRVCPYGAYPCTAREATLIFSYNVDARERREIEFTLGGRLISNKSYIAVAFGDDLSQLVQADLTVCYLERGRAKLEHLLIENLQLPPYKHNEVIELDDFDVDGNMLWCRFRRPINPATVINRNQQLYHYYFSGVIDQQYNRFTLPSRGHIYNSAFKRNFSHAFNEIVSGGWNLKANLGLLYVVLALLFFGHASSQIN